MQSALLHHIARLTARKASSDRRYTLSLCICLCTHFSSLVLGVSRHRYGLRAVKAVPDTQLPGTHTDVHSTPPPYVAVPCLVGGAGGPGRVRLVC